MGNSGYKVEGSTKKRLTRTLTREANVVAIYSLDEVQNSPENRDTWLLHCWPSASNAGTERMSDMLRQHYLSVLPINFTYTHILSALFLSLSSI